MEEEEFEKKQSRNMKIVGINLLILAGYTILCGFLGRQGGVVFDAFFLAAHVLVCIILGAIQQKWIWALSVLVVLLIGVSTCVGILWKLQ
jgi:hypothetical protein